MLTRRLLLLLGILLLVGFATHAFAEPVDRATPLITRAEVVALLVSSQHDLRPRVQWIREHMPALALFKDVSQEEWYAPYLEVAFSRGWVLGNPDRTFRPFEMLRSEEAVTLFSRFKQPVQQDELVLYLPGSEKPSTWYSQPLQATLQNTNLPSTLTIGQPIERSSFYALLRSEGIQGPETIAFVDPPPPPPTRAVEQPSPRSGNRIVALQPVRRQAVSPTRATTPQPRTTTGVRPTTPSRTFSISLPSLGISHLVVTHPSDPFSSKGLLAPLKNGVGHLFSYPGSSGKILVYGHSSSYPWDVSTYTKIFRQINKLNPGDKVYITYEGHTYTYQVTHKQAVPAKDMSAYKNGGSEELILYTCWPPDSISQRYLVHAKPIEKVAVR